MLLRSLVFSACTLLSAGAFAQTTNLPETIFPQIGELPLGNNEVGQFVFGDGAWGETINQLSALQQQPIEASQSIAEQLFASRDSYPPSFLFEAARRFAYFDRELAVYAYFLARSRSLYDAYRCQDPTALAGMDVISAAGGPELTLLMGNNPDILLRQLQRLNETGEAFTSQYPAWWICSSSDTVFFAAANGQGVTQSEWLKPQSSWAEARRTVQANIDANLRIVEAAVAAAAAQEAAEGRE